LFGVQFQRFTLDGSLVGSGSWNDDPDAALAYAPNGQASSRRTPPADVSASMRPGSASRNPTPSFCHRPGFAALLYRVCKDTRSGNLSASVVLADTDF